MKRKKKGLTILEVVLSLAIFAILLIPVANLISYSTKFNKEASEKQKAKMLAQSTIETIKNKDNISQPNITFSSEKTEKDVENKKTYDYNLNNEPVGKYIVTGTIKQEKTIKTNTESNKDCLACINDTVNNVIVITKDGVKLSVNKTDKIKTLIDTASVEIKPLNELKISIDKDNNDNNKEKLKIQSMTPFELNGPIILYLQEPRINKFKIDFINNGSKINMYIFKDNKITSQEFESSIDKEIRDKDEATGKLIENSPVDLYRNMPLQEEVKRSIYYIDLKVIKKDEFEKNGRDVEKCEAIEKIKSETELVEG